MNQPIATPRLMIGAMSGTSADGVDAALVRIEGKGLGMSAVLLQHVHQAYPDEVRQSISAIRSQGRAELAALAALGRGITIAHAEAIKALLAAAGVPSSAIAAIAAHGQTLFHQPPLTIQWFDPALLAWETRCAVVSDFRRTDCAAGGQGAPLVPFADYILFRDPARDRVVLNIGGIANLTHLPAGGTPEQIVAFDTGPGNCVSDHLCRVHDPGGPGYDAGGERALRSRVCAPLAETIMAHPYFSKAGPKSTDGPEMIAIFMQAARSFPMLSFEDLLRTACHLTARTILQAAQQLAKSPAAELIVSGGGSQNAAIMQDLADGWGAGRVLTTDALGVPSQTKEAIAFALLGAATLDGLPSNIPSATGASRSVVLGSITAPPGVA